MEMFSATARVDAAVLRRFDVNQLSNGGVAEKENATATQSRAYRALNACVGRAPVMRW